MPAWMIQKDLSPLVKHLAPGKNGSGAQIPFMAASDGIKLQKVVHQVSSALMGPIIVDDVVYEKVDDDLVSPFPSKELVFRCLTFQRSEGLVQSEALLTPEGCQNVASGKEQKTSSSSKSSKKNGNQRRNYSLVSVTNDSRNELKVDHNYLASSYHTGIISGFMLISSYLESVASTGRTALLQQQLEEQASKSGNSEIGEDIHKSNKSESKIVDETLYKSNKAELLYFKAELRL